jgi:hypothetical protein
LTTSIPPCIESIDLQSPCRLSNADASLLPIETRMSLNVSVDHDQDVLNTTDVSADRNDGNGNPSGTIVVVKAHCVLSTNEQY